MRKSAPRRFTHRTSASVRARRLKSTSPIIEAHRTDPQPRRGSASVAHRFRDIHVAPQDVALLEQLAGQRLEQLAHRVFTSEFRANPSKTLVSPPLPKVAQLSKKMIQRFTFLGIIGDAVRALVKGETEGASYMIVLGLARC